MNAAISAVVKMHARGKLMWFIAPWGIQLTAFLVSLLEVFLRQIRGLSSPGAGDIYIFYFVLGIISVIDTFPFALGFGVRRKDYVLGTLALVAGLFAATALALVMLGFLESRIVNSWGMDLHFFALPYLSAGSFLQQWWVDFSLLLNLFSFGFVIGSIYRRFGIVGVLAFLAFAIPLLATWLTLNSTLNLWGALFAWLSQLTAFGLALGLFPVSALYLLVAYLLLRRAVA
jgi:hypothetical protein